MATIDTSHMSDEKAKAVELAEDAREELKHSESFAASLFMGRFPWSRLHPFPAPTRDDETRGSAFLARMGEILRRNLDADRVDREGEIPDEAVDALREAGAFGIKIPQDYGGLGLSQTVYTKTAILVGSHCANLSAFLSAHQSIGVPQPLLLFGTDEQKRRFLPRLARGELSAFALTEVGAGSDPARMETMAVPDGDHFVINGEKLWATNGTCAKWVVVMAKTPARDGAKRDRITAFIVDADDPGVIVTHRCRFMGHRALYNAVMRFDDVRVPRENVILGEGKGLRVALSTLNTGRLTLPASATGVAKRCLEISRRWAAEREQWGAPIGQHGAIADKLARMAANVFAMEAMTVLTSGLVDSKKGDIRVEAAMCKLWCSERAWEIANDALQIRGGRGYETAESLAARGERPDPVERFVRDLRVLTIFEGSSEILRGMAIAREGLDHHAQISRDVLDSRLPWGRRFVGVLKAGLYYAPWYLSLWLPSAPLGTAGMDPALAMHVGTARRTSKRLARRLFHQMVRHGLGLERMQLMLGRFVDVATEIFAISATCSFAQSRLAAGRARDEVVPLADLFCRQALLRIDGHFRALGRNTDTRGDDVAAAVLADRFTWLEQGTSTSPDS